MCPFGINSSLTLPLATSALQWSDSTGKVADEQDEGTVCMQVQASMMPHSLCQVTYHIIACNGSTGNTRECAKCCTGAQSGDPLEGLCLVIDQC